MSFPGNLLDNLADESTDPPFDPTCIKLEPTLSLVPDGYPMEENLLRKKKSKKGPAPKLFGNERCKICDSKATGFHYNVLSCEACKVSVFNHNRKFYTETIYGGARLTLT